MKYGCASLLFLMNNEVWSLIALNLLIIMFLYDIVKERFFS